MITTGKNPCIKYLKLLLCNSFFSSIVISASPALEQTEKAVGQQLITETSLYLALVLLVLFFVYLSCKTLVHQTLLLLAITGSFAIGVSYTFEKLDFASFYDQQRTDVLEKTSNIRSRIESTIQTNLGISQTLLIYMRSKNYQFTVDEFNAIGQSIMDSEPTIRHLALAENLIINYIYPVEGNKKAIGLNLRTNAQQWPAVERAIKSRKPLLAGPVNMVQGGESFIVRLPVFITKDDTDTLWGVVGVVIDMDSLFQAAGLDTVKKIKIAIRGSDALGADGAVFFGDEQLFIQPSIIQTIKLPEGSWQIAATPLSGWASISPSRFWIRITVFSFYLLIALFIIFRATQHRKQAKIVKKLKIQIDERQNLELEQQQLSKRLHQAQKLEAIGQLTGGIAHDFNNILAAINGYAQLAKSLIDSKTESDRISHYLDEVVKAGNRAKHLVQQMLTFSRGGEIQSQTISPHAITQETLSMLESTIPSSINMVTDYSDTEIKIESDPIQFQQVILNLIVNSRDAITEQMGEIKISLQKVSIEQQHCSSCNDIFSDQYLQISIVDTGLGISAHHLEHVFEPFYSTKEVGEGTGMGLSVVHGIVHAAKGHIIINSTINQGTSIKLFFPILEQSEENEETLVEPEKVEQKIVEGHILIVDDEQAITNLFSILVAKMKMQASIFNDPQAALEYYQQHASEITLVITDQTMPAMTGAELVQEIRQINPDVPIILCTGHSDVIDDNKSEILGINTFLNKPVDINVLSDEIYRFHS